MSSHSCEHCQRLGRDADSVEFRGHLNTVSKLPGETLKTRVKMSGAEMACSGTKRHTLDST